MGESVDADAGGDRPLATAAGGGTEVELGHHRVRIFVDDQGERFESVPDFRRHAHCQGNERGIECRDRRIEHDLTVFCLDGAVAEVSLLQRRPDILLSACR
jgi:hypothetical protein